MIAECKKVAQKEYKQRHDNIARIVHWKLCKKFGLVDEVKCHNHKPPSVVENGRVKILGDFNIQIDHVIQHRRPDIVVLYNTERKCHLIDIAVPWDKRIELKEQEKIDNYSELRLEVRKIWNLPQVWLRAEGAGCNLLSRKCNGTVNETEINTIIMIISWNYNTNRNNT